MAQRNVLLKVLGDSSDGEQTIRHTRDELRRLNRETAQARIEVRAQGVEQQIERVRARLEKLAAKEYTPEVAIGAARATAQLERLELRLARLNHQRVNIDVDVSRGALERTAAGIASVDRAIAGVGRSSGNVLRAIPILGQVLSATIEAALSLGSALGGAVATGVSALVQNFSRLGSLAGPIGAVAGSVVSLGANLLALGAVASGVIIALNALVTALAALGSLLVAVVASLGAAVAGMGALAVAFAGVLGPAVAGVVLLFSRFQAILQARKAHEQAVTQAVQDQKTAEQQRKDALEQVRIATENLRDVTVEARRQMAQAAEDQSDAERQLERSRLGIRERRLDLAKARRDLKEFLRESGAAGPSLDALFKRATDVTSDPSQQRALIGQIRSSGGKADPLELRDKILAVARAQLDVKDAVDQVGDSERNLTEATRKRADFARRGLEAYRPYRSALNAVTRAEERLKRAQDQSSASQRKYEQALKNLTGTERGTLDRVNRLVTAFKDLAKAFSDPIFAEINRQFDALQGKGGTLRTAMATLGTAFAGVVRSFGAFLRDPRTLDAFATMARGAAALTRELGARAFTSFLSIMRDVAVTALPSVISGARRLADWLARIAGQPEKIREKTLGLIGHFRTWAGLAWQVLRAVGGIFRAAAGEGRRFAGDLTTIVRNFADWANSDEGQRKLREFFARMVTRARQILRGIKDIVRWMAEDLPEAAKTAKDAFHAVGAVIDGVINSVRWLQNATTDVANAVGLGADPKDVQKVIQANLAIINREQANLKTRLSPDDRQASRQRLAEALQTILNRRGSVGRQIELSDVARKRLEELLRLVLQRLQGGVRRAMGGIVPGSGRGDIIPAMLEPGEFVVRRAIAEKLGLSAMHALNGGAVPTRIAPVPAMAGGPREVHYHIPPPLDATKPIDPANAAALLDQAIRDRGGWLG